MVEITIISYEMSNDTFNISIDAGTGVLERSTVSATIMPALIGEYGEPEDFVGRCFELDMPRAHIKVNVHDYCEITDSVEVQLPDPKGVSNIVAVPAFMLTFFGITGEPSKSVGEHTVPSPY